MPFLDRPSFIALLQRLDGAANPDNDADVLAAARDIARRMREGGVAWDDLLVQAPDSDVAAPSIAGNASFAEADRDAARALIQALLAKDDIGEETAGDLRDLEGDLDRGSFDAGDLRYVRALRARLGIKPNE